MALPKSNRAAPREQERVFSGGKTVKNSFFFIKYLPNSLGHGRWAVSVPTKISKKSVVRHQIKRKIFEAVKGFEKYPIDAVIVATEAILNKSLAEIKSHFQQVIKKIYVNAHN